MSAIHEIQGYVLVLDKIIHLTRVFEANQKEGSQFNVRMVDGVLLNLKFEDRATATLHRDLLVKALEAQ